MRCVFIIIFAITLCYFVESEKSRTNRRRRQTNVPVDDCSFGYFFNGTACERCGLAQVNPSFRIVGGVNALRNSVPSYVYLYINGGFCGGTLINKRTFLTAAHCVKPKMDYIPTTEYPTIESTVVAGTSLYNWTSDWTNNNRYKASKIVVHPSFKWSEHYYYDIAIVILDRPITLSESEYPACLPEKSNTYPEYNTSVFTVGFGKTAKNESGSYNLKNVNVTVYDPINCHSQAHTRWAEYYKTSICAGDMETGNGVCHGDSGGGLYASEIVDDKKIYVVAGVTSYLIRECGTVGFPNEFTRVSHYIDWIKSNWQY